MIFDKVFPMAKSFLEYWTDPPARNSNNVINFFSLFYYGIPVFIPSHSKETILFKYHSCATTYPFILNGLDTPILCHFFLPKHIVALDTACIMLALFLQYYVKYSNIQP